MTLHEFLEKLQNFWIEAIFSLLTGWIVIRQKFIRDEHNNMKEDIANLKLNHVELNTTLANVKKNQELMRDVQTEIRNDIKTLIGRRADDIKKAARWWK